jgi:hypothetical protein
MGSVHFINYQNLSILHQDFSGCKPEEVIDLLQKSHEIMKSQPPHSVFTLINVKGMRFNGNLIQQIKEAAKLNKPYVKATVVCGLEGLASVLINSVIAFSGREMKVLSDPEEAKAWLWKQSNA